MPTATLDLPDLTIEELTAHEPDAHCTPRLGGERALPRRTTQTSGYMTWEWHPVPHPLLLDNCLIQIGDRTWNCVFLAGRIGRPDANGVLHIPPRTPLQIGARLVDLP